MLLRITVLVLALMYGQASRAALVAYWPFDEGSGTTAFDVAGYTNANNGTLQGGSETPAWVQGRFGSALGFTWQQPNAPGSGKRVVVPFHHELLLNGPFTISFWYRMDAATPSGTFPGIMRIGSQSATTGNNIGWGFFRTSNLVHKRGNGQPGVYPAISVGQWYHVALRWDGTTAANNNIAYLNGVPTTFSQNWLTTTATNVVFELGRMDAFDQATLDELALWWNEAVAPGKIRSIYTVPANINLDYNLADLRVLWSTFDAGAGTTNIVKGLPWSYVGSVPGSTTPGDAYIFGPNLYVVLGNGTGVSAPVRFLTGFSSPGGVGTVGTYSLSGDSIAITNATLAFDLGTNTSVGGTANDLVDVTGDVVLGNTVVQIDPLSALPAATYRLFNYSGAKTGSISVSNTTRYSLSLDESVPHEISLSVSGTNAPLQWISTNSGSWDLSSLNWSNLNTSAPDKFFQGDSVLFDDSGPFQSNITIAAAVFPSSITINSAAKNYTFTGSQIGGAGDGIVKNGASTLTISTPNTFVGNVQVNGGILKLGNASALGQTNGETFIASGATLDLNANSPGTENITVGGSGVNGAGAVINTGASLVNTGLRGRVTFTGDTTFGGVNRWDVFGGRIIGNGFKLTKVGGPEIALSNLGDTGLGDISIVQGTLTVLGNTTLGDTTKTITVSNNAVLGFWQTAPTVLNKPVVMNTTATMRNVTSGGTDITTNQGAVSITGSANFDISAGIALVGGVSGNGTILKANSGTLYLGASNSYSGDTRINAGRLAILPGGSIDTSPQIIVSAGTTFDVSRLAGGYVIATNQTLLGSGAVAGSVVVPPGATVLPGGQSVPATLTVTNSLTLSGGAVSFELAASTTEGSGVNDLINVGGDLNLTGTTLITINPLGLLAVGNNYTLINYAGSLNGTAANLAINNNTHYTLAISTATPGKINVSVLGGAAAQLTWLGGTALAETLWDVQTTPNWSDLLGSAATFFGGDQVVFDDFGYSLDGLHATVDLVGTLTPSSIRMENGTLDYTFQGSGKLSGNSSLTKVFDATATIANTGVNDYIGATLIAGGTLQVGNGGTAGNLGSGPITNNARLAINRRDTVTLPNLMEGTGALVKQNTNLLILSANDSNFSGTISATSGIVRATITNALGNAAGGTTIGSGATLDVNGVNLGAEPVTVSGSGFGGSGALINNGGGQNNALQFLTLAGDTVVGGSGRFDIRAAPTATLLTGGNGYSLTKVGANQFSIVDTAVDPALGDINVNAGILSAEISSGAGDPNKTLTIASGATLQFFNRTTVWEKKHVLNGGATILNNSGDNTMAGPITLNGGTATFNVGGTQLSINDAIGGSGALTKSGTATLTLKANNTYAGATTVSAGTLQLGVGTNGGWVTGPIAVGANTLTVYRSDAVTVSNTLTGTGTLNVRTPEGLIIGSNTINFGTINVGLNTPGRLVTMPGLTANIGSLSVGDSPGGAYGEVYQLGANITASGVCRIGHWPNQISTFTMGAGTLTLTATPTAVVNQNAVAEQNGIIYLGVDGTGILIQTGGVVRAHGIVFDARGDTPGVDTYSLLGGQTVLGPSGLKSGNFDANTTYLINLGSGTLGSSANWTSVLKMTLVGTNANTVIDSGNFTNTLTGALTGLGGLTKAGNGTLLLSGADAFAGGTIVTQGTLVVRGSLGAGVGGAVLVNGGTLRGDGLINDSVVVNSGGTIAPGWPLGRLSVNNSVTLNGNTVINLSKDTNGITTNALLSASSITLGGTLTVNAGGAALTGGDMFQIFNGPVSGSFSAMALPTLAAGLTWDTSQLGVDGTIRVSAGGPAGLAISLSGKTISLTWSNGTAFALQAQTNNPGTGIQSNNWVNVPTTSNGITVDVNTNAGSVFYRLIKP